ncbi:cobyrinate a,c-diamide synthase [Carboxydothermus hydrogenoformans]|nr:cobyrinate a,c-diamide synthase [Carboxydothermus hydrogenoformans]
MMKGFIISGTTTGAGKSTLTVGILAALKHLGLKVQAFKAGPDYLDPTYHRLALAKPTYNLDEILTSPGLVRRLFYEKAKAADVAVVEGVMGLFDGRDEKFTGSTYRLARFLNLPVILVVDAQNLGTTVAAQVYGYLKFKKDIKIAGIILNKVSGKNHAEHLLSALKPLGVKVFGVFYQNELPRLKSRHLGLIPATEEQNILEIIKEIKDKVLAKINFADLLATLPELTVPKKLPAIKYPDLKGKRVAYAFDKAFNFYYQEAIEYLRRSNAEVFAVSPLNDSDFPPVDLLFLGGGYPELFARDLFLNQKFIQNLKKKIQGGLRVYAECGGFIYLTSGVKVKEQTYPLTGILPGEMELTDKLQGLGYYRGKPVGGYLGKNFQKEIWGHKFHYSTYTGPQDNPAYLLQKNGREAFDGVARDNIFASFLHLNFYGKADLVKTLVGGRKG